ncbi:GNAT family N-acetyltransferase [Maribacter antarcticus]|uniref:GNAT family N-acetyltransferase n=1 Tax=Maribacter antarcticus TaxID=505250 RepID=UPI00047A64CD|nr:GNAT family N-acetyltransferase [Maribacter antarcticus]
MTFNLNGFEISPIQEKDAWWLCNFMVANRERFKNDFPGTLKQTLNPTLSELFVQQKTKQFASGEEYLFTIKEDEHRNIFGLIYIKELHVKKGQAELAYYIGYEYKGKGHTTHFINQIIPWTFDYLGLNTLQIIAHKDNNGSTRIAEKLGFTWQNSLKNEYKRYNDTVVNMELYKKYRVAL